MRGESRCPRPLWCRREPRGRVPRAAGSAPASAGAELPAAASPPLRCSAVAAPWGGPRGVSGRFPALGGLPEGSRRAAGPAPRFLLSPSAKFAPRGAQPCRPTRVRGAAPLAPRADLGGVAELRSRSAPGLTPRAPREATMRAAGCGAQRLPAPSRLALSAARRCSPAPSAEMLRARPSAAPSPRPASGPAAPAAPPARGSSRLGPWCGRSPPGALYRRRCPRGAALLRAEPPGPLGSVPPARAPLSAKPYAGLPPILRVVLKTP